MPARALLRAFAALFLACAAAAAAAEGARIEVVPALPDAGTLLRIAVEGRWPDGCTPKLEKARLDGRDLVLQASVPAASCAGAAHAYRIDTRGLPPQQLQLAANGFHRLRFEVQRGSGPPELHGFRLLYAGNDAAAAARPETGFWWPETGGEFDLAGPGIGMQLETQAGGISLGVYGYDGEGGSQWWFGAGDLAGPVAQVELTRLEQGAGPFDPYRAPQSAAVAGEVQLEILSPSRVNAWFVRPLDGGRGLQAQPVSMVRFRFAQQPAEAWLGAWIVLVPGESALRLEFAHSEATPDGFVLRTADGKQSLRCVLVASRRNSPPQECRLDTGTAEIALEQVGLNEMSGWNGDSQRVQALKLAR